MDVIEMLRGSLRPEKLLGHAGAVAAIVAVSWVIYAVLHRAVKGAVRAAGGRIEDEGRRQRAMTVVLLAGSALRYVILFLAAMMILKEVGLNPTPILAGAGLLGLAVGFGAQSLVRDLISGFFIIMEGQYMMGDLVEINGVLGRVEGVGLRSTRVRQPNGKLRYFPNGTVTTADNYTANAVVHVLTVPIALGLEEPETLLREILGDFDREFRALAGPPAISPLEVLKTYASVMRIEVRSIPGRHDLVEQRLAGRVTAALERAGHPLPPGTEVSLALRYPPPGAGG